MSHKQRRPNNKLLEKRHTIRRLFDRLKLKTVLTNALVAKSVRKIANIQRMLTPRGLISPTPQLTLSTDIEKYF